MVGFGLGVVLGFGLIVFDVDDDVVDADGVDAVDAAVEVVVVVVVDVDGSGWVDVDDFVGGVVIGGDVDLVTLSSCFTASSRGLYQFPAPPRPECAYSKTG